MVRNTKYLHMGHIIASSGLPSTNFRQSGDACVKVFCEKRKYPAYKRHFLVDQTSMTVSPVHLGRSLLVWRRKKKLKFYCCVGFKNVPVFETTPTKSSYFPMSTYGTYAGRAAYPDNAGQNTHFHCDHIHNDDYL